MARRTFLRNPQGVDVSDYSDYEKSLNYFNFSQFNGINSNKNYVTIDQASFEEAEIYMWTRMVNCIQDLRSRNTSFCRHLIMLYRFLKLTI